MFKKEKPRVLIIEDCIHSLITLRSIMYAGNFSSLSACGRQGIAVATKEEPDVILLEILLKERNGLQILKELKTNVWTKGIPVIIVTKINTQAYWDEAYALGADGYVVKMDHYSYLIKKIRAILPWNREPNCNIVSKKVTACVE